MSKIREEFRRKWFTKVDARYLAPEYSYKLFDEGIRGETIQIEKFNKLCLPIIDEVVDNPSKERVEQLLKQMKFITKKRRDHHRKAWRQQGRPARLIYGGELPNTDSDSSFLTDSVSPPGSPQQQSPPGSPQQQSPPGPPEKQPPPGSPQKQSPPGSPRQVSRGPMWVT